MSNTASEFTIGYGSGAGTTVLRLSTSGSAMVGTSAIYHETNKPTASDVGLSSVTNDAQVKKLASSTNGYVPT